MKSPFAPRFLVLLLFVLLVLAGFLGWQLRQADARLGQIQRRGQAPASLPLLASPASQPKDLEKLLAEMRQDRQRLAELSGRVAQLEATLASRSVAPVEFTGFQPAKIEHWTSGEKRSWGHEQAAGPPDTVGAGDKRSAWAAKNPDGGEEWLKLDYERAVDLDQVRVIESHNPGAISKVAAIMEDGSERVVWEGRLDHSGHDEIVHSDFPVNEAVKAKSLKVYLDTARVPGWNEIDAVQLMGKDGSQQWATSSSASSSYADP